MHAKLLRAGTARAPVMLVSGCARQRRIHSYRQPAIGWVFSVVSKPQNQGRLMARLLIKSGAAHAQAIELKAGVIRLGRGVENDYFLNDLTVSDQHCEIVFQNNSVLVRDLDSTNGTWIDGQPISESELQPGQSLQLGHFE